MTSNLRESRFTEKAYAAVSRDTRNRGGQGVVGGVGLPQVVFMAGVCSLHRLPGDVIPGRC